MKGDLPPVAVKLLTQLPVRTHARDFGPIVMDRKTYEREYQREYKRAQKAKRLERMA